MASITLFPWPTIHLVLVGTKRYMYLNVTKKANLVFLPYWETGSTRNLIRKAVLLGHPATFYVLK